MNRCVVAQIIPDSSDDMRSRRHRQCKEASQSHAEKGHRNSLNTRSPGLREAVSNKRNSRSDEEQGVSGHQQEVEWIKHQPCHDREIIALSLRKKVDRAEGCRKEIVGLTDGNESVIAIA